MDGPQCAARTRLGQGILATTQAICDYLRIPLGNLKLTRFSDGEVTVEVADREDGCRLAWRGVDPGLGRRAPESRALCQCGA